MLVHKGTEFEKASSVPAFDPNSDPEEGRVRIASWMATCSSQKLKSAGTSIRRQSPAQRIVPQRIAEPSRQNCHRIRGYAARWKVGWVRGGRRYRSRPS